MLTIDEIRAMPDTYTAEGMALNAWGIFYDAPGGSFTVARYSHSEVTTPFDRHWTTDRDYFAHCEPATAAAFQRLTGQRQRKGKPDILDPCESS